MHPHHRPPGRGRVSTGPHARWFRSRLAGARLIEMGAGEHASRVWRSRRARRTRAAALAAGAVLAVSCAVTGVCLLISPADGSVTMTATAYRIGSATLHAIGPGVYTGDGALVLSHVGAELTAGASAVVNGALWVATCEVDAGGTAETCRLQNGVRTLTARDVWSTGGWVRTYSDGRRVTIAAARGVPVPFPVGR